MLEFMFGVSSSLSLVLICAYVESGGKNTLRNDMLEALLHLNSLIKKSGLPDTVNVTKI